MNNWTLKGLTAGKVSIKWPKDKNSDNSQSQQGLLQIPLFNSNACQNNCHQCVDICPTQALSLETNNNTVAMDYGRCINCQACVEICPVDGALDPTWKGSYASLDRNDLIQSSLNQKKSIQTEAEIVGQRVRSRFRGSLHIRHIDAGSCNGCESELQGLLNPYYNLHRLGIFFTPSPRFADLLLITGPVVPQMKDIVLRTWQAMPEPRFVFAAGTCAVSAALFDSGYAKGDGVDAILPVDLYLPGCPPSPASLIHGLYLFTGRTDQDIKDGKANDN